MNADQLKREVGVATAAAWPDFAAEHPALAQTIDQAMLGEYLTRSLADDPAFISAYQAAVEANVAQRALANLVNEFVVPALRRLL
jgi:hypothetical protein